MKKYCSLFTVQFSMFLFLLFTFHTSFFTVSAQSTLSKVDHDSLWNVWQDNSQADTNRLEALQRFTWDGYLFSQPDSAFYFAQLQYDFAQNQGLKSIMARALNIQGVSWRIRGNHPVALDYYQRSLKIREEIDLLDGQGRNKQEIAKSLNNIGVIFKHQGDFPLALEHYNRSLKIKEELGDKKGIAISLNNIGSVYKDQDDYSQALDYHRRSLEIKEELGDKSGTAASLGNIGIIYAHQGNFSRALDYYQRSLKIKEELGDRRGTAASLNSIGSLYNSQQDYKTALVWCQRGLEISEESGAIKTQETAYNCLYEAWKGIGNGNMALANFKKMILLRDSLINEENTKLLTRLEMQYDFDKKESIALAEQEKRDVIATEKLQRQKLIRNGFMGGFGVVLLFAGVVFIQRNRIRKEKDRSELLLLNILPAETAHELKAKGSAEAKLLDHVTVLFTDFQGFTNISERLSPQALVKDLHECFSAFDLICEKYGVEKIKTIGDSFMAAGGLPSPNTTHAHDVVKAAIEMNAFVEEGKTRKSKMGLPFFEIRIGIHTGPVVSGIVGVRKFQYDIWGDTVNTASRMESTGKVGRVNISQSTFEMLQNDPQFTFKSRGRINAKGKGAIEMYFVSEKDETLSG